MGLFDFLFGKWGKNKVPFDPVDYPADRVAKEHFAKLCDTASEITRLAARISMHTRHSVSLDLSGHVDSFEIAVLRDKRFTKEVRQYEKEFYYDYDYIPGEAYYEAEEERSYYAESVREAGYIITRLNEFLDAGKLAPGPVISDENSGEPNDVQQILYPLSPEAEAQCERMRDGFARIAGLAMKINSESGNCVFVHLSGAEPVFEVDIRKNKEEYSEKTFAEEIDFGYSTDLREDGEDETAFYRKAADKAEALRSRLQAMLKNNGRNKFNAPEPIRYE